MWLAVFTNAKGVFVGWALVTAVLSRNRRRVWSTAYVLNLVISTAEGFLLCGLDWRQHEETDPSLFRPLDIEHSCRNAAKARSELGWSPSRSFESVVQLLVDARKGGSLG